MPVLTGKVADVRFIGPLMGRYTLDSRAVLPGLKIFACRLQSISAHTLVVSAPVAGPLGEVVSAHFEPFGTVRGPITRHIEGGFCLDLALDVERRIKLASKIDWFKKRTFAGVSDKRAHRRFMPREPRSALVLADGRVLPCLIIDLSGSGAAVSADLEPAIGEPLAIGKVVTRVVRKLEVGFAVQYVEPQPPEMVEELLRAPEEWARATAEIAAEVDAIKVAAGYTI